jgi:transposase
VVAGHKHKTKLGLVEAINGKIAALRVQVRGHRHRECFELRSTNAAAWKPSPPSAHIVL